MARRYPLEPLVALRREKAEQRAADLGARNRELAREQATARVVRERNAAEQKRIATERTTERAELERGALTARDLAQGELHRAGTEQRLAGLAAEEAVASKRVRRAREGEAAARVVLGRARAEHEAVLRHRQRFEAEKAKIAERAEEDAAADRFLSRRGARRG